MLKSLIYIIIILNSATLFGQVGIGTSTPLANTALDITSDSKGLLVPRINMINDNSPITGVKPVGLLIWNSNTSYQNGVGFYFWDGALWKNFSASISTINTINSNGVVLAPTSQNRNSAWSTDYNGNPRWKRTNKTMEYINKF